jgi:AcrR family transcriptional regulator
VRSASSTEGLYLPSERERIMQGVAELCTERGYRETTVEAIAERSGVGAKRVEKLYGSVEEAMLAAFNATSSQMLAEVLGAYSPDLSEWDSGMLGIKAILEMMAAKPSQAYMSYMGARQMGPPVVHEAYRAGAQMLTMMMERLWEYSELEVQPRTAARAALGGCEAVIRSEIEAGRGESLPAVLPDFVYAATVPFLGQEEALRLARRGRELLAGSGWAA